jgi:hypothetical protein
MRATSMAAASAIIAVALAGLAVAGSIDSPGPLSSGSGMYTLQDLYDYLMSGTALQVRTGFQEPASAPGPTMKSIKQIGDDMQTAFSQCDAVPADVQAGKKYFSTQAGNWGVKTGTLAPVLSWGVRSNAECVSAGGTVYNTGDGTTICKFAAANCPSGWSQAGNWQQYSAASWGGDWCGHHLSTGPDTFSNAQSTCQTAGGWVGQGGWGTCPNFCSGEAGRWVGSCSSGNGPVYAIATTYNCADLRIAIGCR